MDTPTLTHLERLSLANQYRILAATSEGNPREHARYTRNAEILLGGHRTFYHHIFDELAVEVSEEITEEIRDVLQMFLHIQIAIKELPKSEAARLDRHKLEFNGFEQDGPHDNQTRLMVEHLDSYDELKGKQFNTYSPLDLLRYRRMLPVYLAAFKSKEGVTLKVLKVLQII